jgi:amino acid transporter
LLLFGCTENTNSAKARLNQEIARQGFLPFSRILSSNRPFNAPMGGLIVHYIPSLLVIALPPSRETYSFILDVEGYPAQFFGLAISIGLLWLRRTRPDLKRPYRAWLSAVWVRIALSIALITAPFFPEKNPSKAGGLWHATYAVVGVSMQVETLFHLITVTNEEHRIIFGIAYWYVWTILIPRWKGYKLEEEFDVLDDGTTVTRLVHVPT